VLTDVELDLLNVHRLQRNTRLYWCQMHFQWRSLSHYCECLRQEMQEQDALCKKYCILFSTDMITCRNWSPCGKIISEIRQGIWNFIEYQFWRYKIGQKIMTICVLFKWVISFERLFVFNVMRIVPNGSIYDWRNGNVVIWWVKIHKLIVRVISL